MKILTLIIISLFYTNFVNAQSGNTEVIQDNVLYNFSSELVDAAAMCEEYSEDFSKNNPQLKAPVNIDIIGVEGEKCHFMVNSYLQESKVSQYDCLVDPQQMADIVNAMKNNSNDSISVKDNKSGNGETVTDTLFDITLKKISGEACTVSVKEIEVKEEKKDTFVANIDNFSPDFMNALYKCMPYTEEKEIFGNNERIEIKGAKDDKCQLKYDDFNLFLPKELLSNVQSFSDVQMLLRNKNMASYIPSYDYKGILVGISRCTKDNPASTISLQNNTKNDVNIHKGMIFNYEDDGCRIKLLNQVYVAGIMDDYSINCFVEQKDLRLILEVYGELLLKNHEDYITEMKNADDELMYRLQQADLCKKNNIN